VRARALHADVIVLTSALLQLNCVLVRGGADDQSAAPEDPLKIVEVSPGATDVSGAESFVIDSPVLPEELELLPSVLQQARFPSPSGLLATHADWDHVLGPLAFPGTPLGCAETTARRLTAVPGEAQRELRSFDEELYLERPRPLVIDQVQALPVPGHCEIGSRRLELHPTEGHTADGMAIMVPWAGVLVAGDYLSPIEIPMLNADGEARAYLDTLERLRPLLASVEHVVPGHGPVLDRTGAERLLAEDLGYLRALLEHGSEAELPPGRRSREMRAIHARNAASVSG
jgi:glyoxylase-like metal-dependent hydrolase (beta-lactamase superfamily II)